MSYSIYKLSRNVILPDDGNESSGDKSAIDLKLIQEFNGTNVDCVEWLQKVHLVSDIRDIKDLALVIPLRLTGGVRCVPEIK